MLPSRGRVDAKHLAGVSPEREFSFVMVEHPE